jgi:hypothetical protein
MIEPIQTFLDRLKPIGCSQHGGLRAVRIGLHAPFPPVLAVSSLSAAVRAGIATLSEVGSGEVGRLRVHNRSGLPLLGLAGEIVVGGRQDRVLNSSVLIAPGRKAAVDVSCVERRRWSDAGARQGFQPASANASTAVRSAVHHTMVCSLRQTGLHTTDQGRVWDQVHATLQRTGTDRTTTSGTLVAGLDRHSARLDDCARACAPMDGQVGLALFTPGALGAGLHGFASIDCFGSPDLLCYHAERLVRGAALEARDDLNPTLSMALSPDEVARQILGALSCARPVVSRPAAGDAPGAQEHHYILDGIVASVICHEGWPIHLAITPTDESGGPNAPGGGGQGKAGSAPGSARFPADHRLSDLDPRIPTDDHRRPPRDRGTAFRTRFLSPSPPNGAHQPVIRSGAAAESLPACQVCIICPGAETRTLWLSPGTYLIGRSSACDIQLDEPSVSRRHARLDVCPAASGIVIRDLDSSNGTRVNQEPVLFATIKAGDVINLGDNVTLQLLDINGRSQAEGAQ